MANRGMAYVLIAWNGAAFRITNVVVAYLGMVYVVISYGVMAYVVMVCVVMAWNGAVLQSK